MRKFDNGKDLCIYTGHEEGGYLDVGEIKLKGFRIISDKEFTRLKANDAKTEVEIDSQYQYVFKGTVGEWSFDEERKEILCNGNIVASMLHNKEDATLIENSFNTLKALIEVTNFLHWTASEEDFIKSRKTTLGAHIRSAEKAIQDALGIKPKSK